MPFHPDGWIVVRPYSGHVDPKDDDPPKWEALRTPTLWVRLWSFERRVRPVANAWRFSNVAAAEEAARTYGGQVSRPFDGVIIWAYGCRREPWGYPEVKP
jgi:hypothetical protein